MAARDPVPAAARLSEINIMRANYKLSVAAAAMSLAACTSVPTGPSMMALPGTGKNFDQFRVDDRECKLYALEQVNGATPNKAAEDSAVKSAIIGTAIGAAAGAAMDGSSGAAAGAGVGLLMGGIIGAGAGDQSSRVAQRRYDNGYIQCMYAKGHRVPVTGNYTQPAGKPTTASFPPPPGGQAQPAQPPLAEGVPPPPPPGSPPPPASHIVQ